MTFIVSNFFKTATYSIVEITTSFSQTYPVTNFHTFSSGFTQINLPLDQSSTYYLSRIEMRPNINAPSFGLRSGTEGEIQLRAFTTASFSAPAPILSDQPFSTVGEAGASSQWIFNPPRQTFCSYSINRFDSGGDIFTFGKSSGEISNTAKNVKVPFLRIPNNFFLLFIYRTSSLGFHTGFSFFQTLYFYLHHHIDDQSINEWSLF